MRTTVLSLCRTLLCVAALALSALPAFAQATDQPRPPAPPRGLSLTPFVAMGDDFAIGGGAAFAFPIDRRFSVEAEGSAGLDAIRTGVSLLVNLRSRGITPYAAAGLGFQRDEYEDWTMVTGWGVIRKKSEFAVSIGGGAMFPVGDRWSYRADFRWYNPRAEWPESWRVYSGLTLALGQDQ